MPEGAEGVNFKSNIDLTRADDSNRYTFLDTTGRVVVTTKVIFDYSYPYPINKIYLQTLIFG